MKRVVKITNEIEYINDRNRKGKKEMFYMKVKKAIIPAAGLGTRFLPATK